MEIEEAYRYVSSNFAGDPGRFYDPGARLPIGKGGIFQDVIYAAFDPSESRFRTLQGLAYVLTHECDVDSQNDRIFNDSLLVCPIIPLDLAIEALGAEMESSKLRGFLANLGARNVSRVAYLPPISQDLPYGGLLNLNHITHAPAEATRSAARRVCFLSSFGLRDIEYMLENHLLRPKAARIAFGPAAI